MKYLYYINMPYYLTNHTILTTKGILSTISHYNDKVTGGKSIRIVKKGLVLLITVALVRARWCKTPQSEVCFRPNCNFRPWDCKTYVCAPMGWVLARKFCKHIFEIKFGPNGPTSGPTF